MNNKILYVITAVWVLFFIGIYALGLFERPTTFNELGDFLAGVFAPLGFLWLIYGYRQQGKQLEQNSIAINQQAKALQQQAEVLKLQIDEMKESVKYQKELADVNIEHKEMMKQNSLPYIVISDGYIDFKDDLLGTKNNKKVMLRFNIVNEGKDRARFLKFIVCDILLKKECRIVKPNEKLLIQFELSEAEKHVWFVSGEYYRLKLEFYDIYGTRYDATYDLEVDRPFQNESQSVRIFSYQNSVNSKVAN